MTAIHIERYVYEEATSQQAVIADKGKHLLEMTAALVGPCTIRTYTGQMVDLFDPDPETLCIEDVAHHLSLINRFTGATGRAYSVAEHSLLGRLACSEPVKLLFLLHDAPEAWLGDVAGPLKRLLAPLYKPLEQRFWERLATKYGVPVELPEEVHTVDKRMLATEQRDLQGRKPKPEDAYQPFDWELDYMCGDILRAEDNEQAFLRTFYLDLQKGRWRA